MAPPYVRGPSGTRALFRKKVGLVNAIGSGMESFHSIVIFASKSAQGRVAQLPSPRYGGGEMGRDKKRSTPRAQRRASERDVRKLVRERQRLAGLEPGGAADRPIVVTSSAVIDGRARSHPCPLCGGSLRLEEHGATVVGDRSLRPLELTCQACGIRRTLWFEIIPGAN
jgi:hypothetical protein